MTKMRDRRHVDKESFDTLLGWLHPDRELAAKKYEDIRHRLITIFACRGCAEAEDLADETFDRVTRKVCEVTENYVGDPALYFYGVARNIHLEYTRKLFNRPASPPPPQRVEEEQEPEYECLEECMGKLPREDREMVLQYYKEDKRAKIEHRKQLAAQLGIAINALRIRAYKVRLTLQKCVQECVAGRSA